jgi:predicted TIM-barrel fold metal-dependent hydrolase
MRVTDCHAHVWLKNADGNRRELIEAIEAVPIERMWVSGLCGELPEADVVTQINDAVATLMRDCPRVAGFAYLNPRHEDSVLDELKCRVDQGFVGIKLWIATRADDPRNVAIYEAAIEMKLPVLVHCFVQWVPLQQYASEPADVAAAARRHPECTFIMAHIAGDFVAGADAIAGLPNVCVDISGTYGENGMIEYAVARLGPERVLFGSDMPGSDYYHNLGKVIGADVSDEVKALVLHGNAERILGCPTA